MSPEFAAATALIAYQVIVLAIGLGARKVLPSAEDFHLGGRRSGAWVTAISSAASSSSAWTLLGVSAAAYRFGLGALWLFPACVGGFVLNWTLIAPRLAQQGRRSGALTLTEFLSGGPGRNAYSVLASIVILSGFALYVGQQFNAAGKAFETSFGWDAALSIGIGGGVVLAYTWIGGFTAVARTDLFQGLLMAAAAVIIPIAALNAVGGFAPIWADLSTTDLFRNAKGPAAIGFVLGLFGIGLGYPGQPHVVNRFLAMREGEATLQLGQKIGIGWAVLIYSGMLLTGFCGRLLLPDLKDPEALLFSLCGQLFPPVVQGLLIATILSAVMSTADSQLLVGAGTLTHDLQLFQTDHRQGQRADRWIIALLCLAGVILALYGPRRIFDATLLAWGLLAATFAPLLVHTLWFGAVRAGRAAIAAGCGVAATGIAYALGERSSPLLLVWPLLLVFAILSVGHRTAR